MTSHANRTKKLKRTKRLHGDHGRVKFCVFFLLDTVNLCSEFVTLLTGLERLKWDADRPTAAPTSLDTEVSEIFQ